MAILLSLRDPLPDNAVYQRAFDETIGAKKKTGFSNPYLTVREGLILCTLNTAWSDGSRETEPEQESLSQRQ